MIGIEKPHCQKTMYLDYYLNQAGGNSPAFVGARYQKGHGLGNMLKILTRFALPFLKKGAKSIGQQALKTGMDIAGDVMAGKKVKPVAKHHLSRGLKNLIKQHGKGEPPGKRAGYKRKAPSSKPVTSQKTKKRRRYQDILS